MNHWQFLLIVLLFISCSQSQESTYDNNLTQEEIDEQQQEVIIPLQENLENIFGTVDSTKIVDAFGCVQGYFGYISSEYILRIPASIYTENESITKYNIDTNKIECELLIFKKDSANFGNICTDVIITNFFPKPLRVIKGVSENMTVLIGDKEELWGNEVNNAYIKIDKLEFIDSLNSNKRIIIEDKIFWKVINSGTPG